MRKINVLHLVKLANCNKYLVKYDQPRVVSAAIITPEAWERLAELQLRYRRENQAWRIIQPHENDTYRNTWGHEMVSIVSNIRRHCSTGNLVQRRTNLQNVEVVELSVGGCRVASELFKKYGWPSWFNQEKFDQAVATLE